MPHFGFNQQASFYRRVTGPWGGDRFLKTAPGGAVSPEGLLSEALALNFGPLFIAIIDPSRPGLDPSRRPIARKGAMLKNTWDSF